jgi:hypothetical protein
MHSVHLAECMLVGENTQQGKKSIPKKAVNKKKVTPFYQTLY